LPISNANDNILEESNYPPPTHPPSHKDAFFPF